MFFHSVAGCPSLLCEELDLETKNDQGRRTREEQEEVFSQMEDGEPGEEAEREEEGDKERKVSGEELMVTEREEEEQVKPESRLEVEEEQEVQMEESIKETKSDKQHSNETKCVEENNEQRKGRRRRGRKQSERVKNRRGVKVASVLTKEQQKQIQEVLVMTPEESSTLPEPPFGLMNGNDLSHPIYLGCGGTGMYCPPAPGPLLYPSQPPIPIQPAPPQPHRTKRPHSPLPPHSLPQQAPQSLEVRVDFVSDCRSLSCLTVCDRRK